MDVFKYLFMSMVIKEYNAIPVMFWLKQSNWWTNNEEKFTFHKLKWFSVPNGSLYLHFVWIKILFGFNILLL